MASAPVRMWVTMAPSPEFMSRSAERSSVASSRPLDSMREVRSPEATRRATATESEIGPVMLRVIDQASMTASTSTTPSTT